MPERFNIVFFFPQVYRPFQASFARRFELLSNSRCSGYIFTLCSESYRSLTVGNFRLFSERIEESLIRRVLKLLDIQVMFPIWLFSRSARPDAVVAYDPYTSSLAGMILKLLFGTKLIVELNGDYHKMEASENFVKRLLAKLLFYLSLRYADAVKVINRDQENFVRHNYRGKQIFRFPDFTGTHYFQTLECFQGDYLLSVGHPFYLKGMDILIRAFKLIERNHPTIKLKIMGYCPENELKQYRQLAQNDSRIEFVPPGWMEDVGEQMRGCYALVNAARFEAMGRVHFEAMACKKPVVATRTNGGLDYIDDGCTGLLCEIDDVDDLAEKLDRLLSRPKLATQMGQAGFERLQKDFSEEHYTKAFLAMLQDILSSRSRVAA